MTFLDPLTLSRIQFAVCVSFHYIYPPLSIGLSLILIPLSFLREKDPFWERSFRFWLRIFALTFLFGVASGLPLPLSLGTNWANWSKWSGDVSGPFFVAEGLSSFLVEGTFLALLLYGGLSRMGRKLVCFCTCMVSLGAHLSGFWIVSLNSWIHDPSGYTIVSLGDGNTKAVLTSFWAAVFNGSTIANVLHVFISAWITALFLVIGISAYYAYRERYLPFAQRTLQLSLWASLACLLLQLVSADHVGRTVARRNPTQLAAYEGVYVTERATPAYAVGWVDSASQKTYGIKIPGLLSLMVNRNLEPVQGLDKADPRYWPNVSVVFQMYHLMVLCWGVMVLFSVLGIWFMHYREKFPPFLSWVLMLGSIVPHIANIAGWSATCMGRQPWIVHKAMLTKDGVTSNLTLLQTSLSLAGFTVIYFGCFFLFLSFLFYYVRQGPNDIERSPRIKREESCQKE